MLTPEYLESIEFNRVVELYNKLNIQITADIINRISVGKEITQTSIKQLEVLLETNGAEVFNQALEETSLLTYETKQELKLMFENMAKEDMEGYKELYSYRDKVFKLTESQYKLLNEGLRKTNRALKNLTNTIAFQSKQTYIETVDSAYMKAASGAFDYQSAISTACQELANKGVTLKDKLGRNVQLEVAVRRNVMAGIQETANNMNRNIEEYLGCDGKEVTAHSGARPSHAEEQGKQFALNKTDAKKFGIGLWSDVESLWEEYNCRHTYFGIILGISEPQYTNKELQKMKNATVMINGKEVPLYEATQKQRQIENAIRKQKRTVDILEKSKMDTTVEKIKLRQLNKKYTEFCNETGLSKQYGRIKIAKINSTNNNNDGIISKNINKKENKMKYQDITNEMYNNAKPKKGRVEKQKFYEVNGTIYKVDGHNVVYKHDEREMEVAKLLNKTFGGNVKILPNINFPQGIKSPDYLYKGERTDLKRITSKRANDCVKTALKNKEKQANNFIIDNTAQTVKDEDIIKQIEEIYNLKGFEWLNKIYILRDKEFIKVYKRK